MVIMFLFMTKIKREQEAARMKTAVEINKEACAFPYDKSTTNWSAEEFVDGSYKISSFINQI